jgi:putative redox protein
MKIFLEGTPDFHFRSQAADGTRLEIGASRTIGGDESGFRPMQLVLAAMGSCAGIDVVNILKKSRVEFTTLGIEVEGQRKEGAIPSPFTEVRINFLVRGGKEADLPKAEKAVSLGVEKYCSVAASLDPNIRVTHTTAMVP